MKETAFPYIILEGIWVASLKNITILICILQIWGMKHSWCFVVILSFPSRTGLFQPWVLFGIGTDWSHNKSEKLIRSCRNENHSMGQMCWFNKNVAGDRDPQVEKYRENKEGKLKMSS